MTNLTSASKTIAIAIAITFAAGTMTPLHAGPVKGRSTACAYTPSMVPQRLTPQCEERLAWCDIEGEGACDIVRKQCNVERTMGVAQCQANATTKHVKAVSKCDAQFKRAVDFAHKVGGKAKGKMLDKAAKSANQCRAKVDAKNYRR